MTEIYTIWDANPFTPSIREERAYLEAAEVNSVVVVSQCKYKDLNNRFEI